MTSRGAFITAMATAFAVAVLATAAIVYQGNRSNGAKDSDHHATTTPGTTETALSAGGDPLVPQKAAVGQTADRNPAAGLEDSSVWASHVLSLRVLADDGDRAAGIKLFEESYDCRLYHSAVKNIPVALGDRRSTDSRHPSLVLVERDAAELHRLQAILEKTTSLCEGSDPDFVEQVFQVSRLRAARQGYQIAQSCYVGRPSFLSGASATQLRKLRDEYIHYAPIFMKLGLERGDWPMAKKAAYQLIASGIGHPSWQDDVPPPDPYLTWRAVRLNYYRAKPEQQSSVIHLLKQIERKFGFTDRQMQQGDAWARDMYDKQYANLSPLKDVENVQDCR